MTSIKKISAIELRNKIFQNSEFSLLDVRDGGVHARDGHILRSLSLPLGIFEIKLADLIPLTNTEIIVYDEGNEALATKAISLLNKLGYLNVYLLEGGTASWKSAGYFLFTGVHVIGKAFGEVVEEHYHTPYISVNDFHKRRNAGENIALIDIRTQKEYLEMSIDGAQILPGAEAVYRFHELIKDPETQVVVHCAGRTRSIIAAQALINAGIPNPVSALANGTMDWLIEGYETTKGKLSTLPLPSGRTLAKAEDSTRILTSRFELKYIDFNTLKSFQKEHLNGERSLYLLDVRTQNEYENGHLPGSRWAPGGQLVQQVSDWVGTQHSRIVLIDEPDNPRAAITASWLKQLNWAEVFILQNALSGSIEVGKSPVRIPAAIPESNYIDANQLNTNIIQDDIIILDIAPSIQYRAGHIPSSRYVLRSQLLNALSSIPSDKSVVLTSTDGILASFAAAEASEAGFKFISVLQGGTDSWVKAGFQLSQTPSDSSHEYLDVWSSPYKTEDPYRAFREYLDWELGLIEQLKIDGTARFNFPAL